MTIKEAHLLETIRLLGFLFPSLQLFGQKKAAGVAQEELKLMK